MPSFFPTNHKSTALMAVGCLLLILGIAGCWSGYQWKQNQSLTNAAVTARDSLAAHLSATLHKQQKQIHQRLAEVAPVFAETTATWEQQISAASKALANKLPPNVKVEFYHPDLREILQGTTTKTDYATEAQIVATAARGKDSEVSLLRGGERVGSSFILTTGKETVALVEASWAVRMTGQAQQGLSPPKLFTTELAKDGITCTPVSQSTFCVSLEPHLHSISPFSSTSSIGLTILVGILGGIACLILGFKQRRQMPPSPQAKLPVAQEVSHPSVIEQLATLADTPEIQSADRPSSKEDPEYIAGIHQGQDLGQEWGGGNSVVVGTLESIDSTQANGKGVVRGLLNTHQAVLWVGTAPVSAIAWFADNKSCQHWLVAGTIKPEPPDKETLPIENPTVEVPLKEPYLAHLTSNITLYQPIKVAIDGGSDIATEWLGEAIRRIGGIPKPTNPEESMQDIINKEKPAFGMAIDLENRGLKIYAHDTHEIPEEAVALALIKERLSTHPGAAILYEGEPMGILSNRISELGGVPIALDKESNWAQRLHQENSPLAWQRGGIFWIAGHTEKRPDGFGTALFLLEIMVNDPEGRDPEKVLLVAENAYAGIVEHHSTTADSEELPILSLSATPVVKEQNPLNDVKPCESGDESKLPSLSLSQSPPDDPAT